MIKGRGPFPVTTIQWSVARQKRERRTSTQTLIIFNIVSSAAEKAAAMELKKLLKEAGNNIDGVLSIINRYKDVAVRPQVVRELTAER